MSFQVTCFVNRENKRCIRLHVLRDGPSLAICTNVRATAHAGVCVNVPNNSTPSGDGRRSARETVTRGAGTSAGRHLGESTQRRGGPQSKVANTIWKPESSRRRHSAAFSVRENPTQNLVINTKAAGNLKPHREGKQLAATLGTRQNRATGIQQASADCRVTPNHSSLLRRRGGSTAAGGWGGGRCKHLHTNGFSRFREQTKGSTFGGKVLGPLAFCKIWTESSLGSSHLKPASCHGD